MRMNKQFEHFVEKTVNLPDSKLKLLDDSVRSVFNVLNLSDAIGTWVLGWDPQGSWTHRTIINPPRATEFDADFMLVLAENPAWADTPASYTDAVWKALDAHGTYKAMPHERKCRCVRLTYKNDFHLDIVPFVRRSTGDFIVNRDLREGKGDWEPTNPQGFTTWFNDKDDITNGNLRVVIRILKYLRDSKATFRGTRSVILNTLVGKLVTWDRRINTPGCYDDVPTTLLTVTTDLDNWLQAHRSRPSVEDPAGTGLTFDHRWDDAAYNALRDRMEGYAATIRAAYNEPDEEASLSLWQDLFGTGFCLPPTDTGAPRFSPILLPTRTTPSRAG